MNDRHSIDADDVFLAMLRPEEERDMSFAVAKAALVAEKWLAADGDSLSARAWKTLRALPSKESAGKGKRFRHE